MNREQPAARKRRPDRDVLKFLAFLGLLSVLSAVGLHQRQIASSLLQVVGGKRASPPYPHSPHLGDSPLAPPPHPSPRKGDARQTPRTFPSLGSPQLSPSRPLGASTPPSLNPTHPAAGNASRGETCQRDYIVQASPCSSGPGALGDAPTPPLPPHRDNRALVLYFLGGEKTAEYARHNYENLAHFVRFGVYRTGFRTALHTGIDYYFFRMVNGTRGVEDWGTAPGGQHTLLAVPPGPCDLCHHSRVLAHLGIDFVEQRYRTVVMLNSGVRGPFASPRSSPWIDVVTAAGRSEFPGAECPDPPPGAGGARAFAVSISWEWKYMHSQTYFGGYPRAALRPAFGTYAGACRIKTKKQCVHKAEILVLQALLRSTNTSTWSSSQQFAAESVAEEGDYRLRHARGTKNPTNSVLDPCEALFVKAGGVSFRVGAIPREVLDRIHGLSAAKPPPGEGLGFSFGEFGDQAKVRAFLGVDRQEIGL